MGRWTWRAISPPAGYTTWPTCRLQSSGVRNVVSSGADPPRAMYARITPSSTIVSIMFGQRVDAPNDFAEGAPEIEMFVEESRGAGAERRVVGGDAVQG